MAMRFTQAGRAETPDLLGAEIAQGNFDQMKSNAKQLRNQQTMSGLGSTVMGAHQLGLLGGGTAAAGTAGTAGTAGAAGAAAPAAAGAAGAGGAGGAGAAGTLGAMGPYGWAALAALAIGSMMMN